MGVQVLETHSRKSQAARTRVAEAFRNGKGQIMFTSDVSARGMDYPDVSLVIQVGWCGGVVVVFFFRTAGHGHGHWPFTCMSWLNGSPIAVRGASVLRKRCRGAILFFFVFTRRCMDFFSRRAMYIQCSSRWPSRPVVLL